MRLTTERGVVFDRLVGVEELYAVELDQSWYITTETHPPLWGIAATINEGGWRTSLWLLTGFAEAAIKAEIKFLGRNPEIRIDYETVRQNYGYKWIGGEIDPPIPSTELPKYQQGLVRFE